MTYTGQVVGDKVVFDGPAPLPDGTPVRVEAVPVAGANGHYGPAEPEPDPAEPIPTLYERLKGVIGKAEGLPEDAALNHDHYLYGVPKRL